MLVSELINSTVISYNNINSKTHSIEHMTNTQIEILFEDLKSKFLEIKNKLFDKVKSYSSNVNILQKESLLKLTKIKTKLNDDSSKTLTVIKKAVSYKTIVVWITAITNLAKLIPYIIINFKTIVISKVAIGSTLQKLWKDVKLPFNDNNNLLSLQTATLPDNKLIEMKNKSMSEGDGKTITQLGWTKNKCDIILRKLTGVIKGVITFPAKLIDAITNILKRIPDVNKSTESFMSKLNTTLDFSLKITLEIVFVLTMLIGKIFSILSRCIMAVIFLIVHTVSFII